MIGSFIAAAAVYVVYLDALKQYSGDLRIVVGPNATAGIWSTYPEPYLSMWGCVALYPCDVPW